MDLETDVDVDELEQKQFAVTDPSSANWALSKLRYYKSRAKEVEDLYDAEQRRLDDWREEQTKSLAKPIEYFEGLLTSYHHSLFAEDEKRKTVKLPNGTLKSQSIGGGILIADPDSFVESAPENLLIIKKAPNKTAIKDLLKETGELPAGVSVEPKTRKFSVEVVV